MRVAGDVLMRRDDTHTPQQRSARRSRTSWRRRSPSSRRPSSARVRGTVPGVCVHVPCSETEGSCFDRSSVIHSPDPFYIHTRTEACTPKDAKALVQAVAEKCLYIKLVPGAQYNLTKVAINVTYPLAIVGHPFNRPLLDGRKYACWVAVD